MRELPRRHKFFILGGILLAMLLGALDQTIVGTAMPQVVQELGGMALLTWVFTAYALTSTISIPIVGKLSDLYGRKWFYLAGIAVFVLGSALSGAAGSAVLNRIVTALFGDSYSMHQLIVFRGIQGLGAGVMMANALALIGDLFEPRERGRYQGLMGAVFGLASVLGPSVGGWLTDNLSWRWIFYVNLPLGALAIAVLLAVLPTPERGQRHAIDWWGSLALIVGLVPLLLALVWGGVDHAWDSPTILGLLGVFIVATLAFLFIESRVAEPILDLSLFRTRLFSVTAVAVFFSGIGMFGSIMFLPIFMQMVQGKTATSSGALLMPMMISMVLASIATGQVIAKTGRYKAVGVAGFVLATYGMFRLSGLQVDSSAGEVLLDMVLVGSGVGVSMPLFTVAVQSRFPDKMGVVTAATQFFRSIGGTVGVALLGGVMNASLQDNLKELMTEHRGRLGPLGERIARVDDPEKLLNPQALEAMRDAILGQGGAAAQQLQAAFTLFQTDLRLALAHAISHTFFWGFVMMAVAATAMVFIEEVSLAGRERTRDAAEEAGVELLDGEAVLPAEVEPELG